MNLKTRIKERLDKEKFDAKMVDKDVKYAKVQMQKHVLDCETTVTECETRLEDIKSQRVLDAPAIILAKRNLDNAKEDLADLKEIQTELFGK